MSDDGLPETMTRPVSFNADPDDRLRVLVPVEERDALRAEVAALTAERDRLRDNAEVLAGELRHLAAEHGRCDARLEEEWRRAFNAEAERDTLAAKLARERPVIADVRAIHARNEYSPYYCKNCRAPWPCRTVAAVDAYQATPVTTEHCDHDWTQDTRGPFTASCLKCGAESPDGLP